MRTRWIAAALVASAAGAAGTRGGGAQAAPASGIDVAIETAAGRPAEMASVLLLGMGGSDREGNWLIAPRPLLTKSDGHVQWPAWTDHACFFAWKDDEAAFECGVALASNPAQHRLRLVSARRIVARAIGPDGRPAKGVRARIAIAGAQEWHFLDAEVAADGTLSFPPIPPDALRNHETHIEARAPGCVEAQVPVTPESVGKTIPVSLVAARRVHGTVRADDAVRGAVLHTDDFWHGPRATIATDGSFAIDSLAPGTRRLYLTSKSHAPRVLDLPEAQGDVDLGVVALERGRAVSGKVLAAGGGKGGEMSVGLIDDRGVGVAWIDTDVRAAYDFPHVGKGIDHLAARRGGPGGDLWIFDRGKLDGDLAAPPFEVRFEDSSGARALVEAARITWSDGTRKETIPVRMFSYTAGVSAVRLRLPGPGSLRVEVEGAKPVMVEHADVDADGRGSCTVVVAK